MSNQENTRLREWWSFLCEENVQNLFLCYHDLQSPYLLSSTSFSVCKLGTIFTLPNGYDDKILETTYVK
jgi:hypothetical protein